MDDYFLSPPHFPSPHLLAFLSPPHFPSPHLALFEASGVPVSVPLHPANAINDIATSEPSSIFFRKNPLLVKLCKIIT